MADDVRDDDTDPMDGTAAATPGAPGGAQPQGDGDPGKVVEDATE